MSPVNPSSSSELSPSVAVGELVIKSESGRLLHAEPARVDLATGALTVENGISRTSYDWGYDIFFFRLSKRGEKFEVEEGCEVAPHLDFCVSCDLGDLQEAWRQKLASGLDRTLPKSKASSSRPRM